MSETFVIDASVAAKWFLGDEEHVAVARRFLTRARRNEITLHAPAIFPHELCNLLARACGTHVGPRREPRLKLEQALFGVYGVFGVPVELEAFTPRQAVTALEHAVTYHKAFDDMTYLALAEKLDCLWVTADEKVLRSSPHSFPGYRVIPLSSL